MPGDVTPPNAASADREPDPEWLQDLEEDLRRAVHAPDPAPPRGGLLGRLFEPGA